MVRSISHRVGYMGEPADWFWRHAERTLLENARAVAFFERMGFRRLGAPLLVPGMRSPSGGRHHLLLMVHDLEREGG